jgi:hypothetical protein
MKRKKKYRFLIGKQANGNSDAAALLIKLGANVTALDNGSRNLLHCAVESGELPMASIFRAFCFLPMQKATRRCTLLQKQAIKRCLEN